MKLVRFLAIAVILVAAQVGGQTLYGTTGAGGGVSTLVQLDPATGAQIASVGSVGYAVNGMAWDPTTATVYATTSYHDSTFSNGLLTINLATGAGTPIGTGAGQPGLYINLPTCNAAGVMYGWADGVDDLVLWNKVAGTVTVVGDSGLSTQSNGLDFAPSGILYLVNRPPTGGTNAEIYTVDTTTGLPTAAGQVGPLAYGLAHHGKFNPADGFYYGIDRTPEYDSTGFQIVVIDVATQSIVRTMSTVDNLHTLVFASRTAPGIPVLSGTGLIAMLVLLIGTAVFIVRRRL